MEWVLKITILSEFLWISLLQSINQSEFDDNNVYFWSQNMRLTFVLIKNSESWAIFQSGMSLSDEKEPKLFSEWEKVPESVQTRYGR